jgi:hypothetical protein
LTTLFGRRPCCCNSPCYVSGCCHSGCGGCGYGCGGCDGAPAGEPGKAGAPPKAPTPPEPMADPSAHLPRTPGLMPVSARR